MSLMMTALGIVPVLRYRDARSAINWLCDTWGFEERVIVEGPDESIQHAELSLGKAFILLASTTNSGSYTQFTKQPDEVGGQETQSPYLIVDNPEKYYELEKKHGATILLELKKEDYGGSNFTCADPEGHIWNFGSYNPYEQ
jgi:uncharacterized glyoxalase superfamily protein PhnB